MIYFLQVGEKGTAWCRLKARGVSCHGSVPSLGENAVLKLSRALVALGEYRPEIKLIPEVETLLRELARFRGLSYDPARMQSIRSSAPRFGAGFAETLRAMTRMTVSPNRVEGGLKTNIVPDRCVAELDIRILPGQDRAYVEGELRRLIGEEIEIEFMNYIAPTFSTSQSDYYRLLESLTLELAGREAVCLPYVSTGSTDSKYLRGAGIPLRDRPYGCGLDQAVRLRCTAGMNALMWPACS